MNWLDGFSDQSDLIQGYSTERCDFHHVERSARKNLHFPLLIDVNFGTGTPNVDSVILK